MRWQQTMRHGDRSRSRSEIPRIPALCRMGEWRFSFEGVSGIVRHAVFTISHQFSHQSLAPGKALDRTRSGRFGGVILALGATGKPSAGPRPSGPCVSLDSSPSAGAVTSSSETRRSLSRGEACDLPGHVATKTKRRSRKHSKHPRARGREEEGAPKPVGSEAARAPRVWRSLLPRSRMCHMDEHQEHPSVREGRRGLRRPTRSRGTALGGRLAARSGSPARRSRAGGRLMRAGFEGKRGVSGVAVWVPATVGTRLRGRELRERREGRAGT